MKGGRCGCCRCGPTYHEAGGRGGRTIGAKRSILVERLGLPVAAQVDSARPHDLVAGRALLHDALPELPRVHAVLADRGHQALGPAAGRHGAHLAVKAQPAGSVGFVPVAMLWRAENAFAQLGRWRRLSRCFKGTTASAGATPSPGRSPLARRAVTTNGPCWRRPSASPARTRPMPHPPLAMRTTTGRAHRARSLHSYTAPQFS